MISKMYKFTKAALEKIYDIVDDKVLKGKIVAIVDYNSDVDILYNDPIWSHFVSKNIHEIRSILGHNNKIADKSIVMERRAMSDYSYHGHYLDIEFDKLIRKSEDTGNIEYAYIKLKEDSGMTELKDKKSLRRVGRRLEDIGLGDDQIKKIIRSLYELGVYNYNEEEEDKENWWVSLSISSEKKLCLLLFDGVTERKGYGGHYFTITNNYKKIVDIIMRKGYYENHIGEAIDMIIEGNKKGNQEEDDDYDMV